MKEVDLSLLEFSRQIALDNDPHKGNNPEISVIIPCFNSENFIPICLESLAQQTLCQKRFEVICIDDCSTDRTAEVVLSFQDRIRNLKLIKHVINKKQGGARNTGIDQSTGKFVLFLDSDDFLRLDALELLIGSASEGAEVVMGQLLKVRYDRPYRAQPTAKRSLGHDVVRSTFTNSLGWFALGMIISREFLNKNSVRFSEGMFFEDIKFCSEVYLRADRLKTISDCIYMYVQRDDSTVNSMTEKKLDDSALAMSQMFKLASQFPGGIDIFKGTALNWLRLQASRVRDGTATLSERGALGEFLVAKAGEYELEAYLSAAELGELAKIAVGNPKPFPQHAAAIGAVTCSSPWGGKFESDFAGKVIFFCEVDYHVRSAAPVARALREMGIYSIIVDAAKSTSFTTNRPLPESERSLYSDLDIREFNIKEVLPFSTEAAAFVFMNDLTYTKQLIFENFGFGVPTFGFYEGINDDWNLDRVALRRPYRSVDYLLLPGIYQQGFYDDRECRIVGLPNVRSRLMKPFVAPRLRRAVINVNFTYGVLEDRRSEFVETAVQACHDLGLDYVITQHPADKADLSAYNVAQTSVYDLLDEGTILISRFSTTILEALAMGRPVVYHNPIAENVPKFSQPLGAYSISVCAESLKQALLRELNFIDGGGDVRARAALFLHFHCHSGASEEPEALAATAIYEVLSRPCKRHAFKIGQSQRTVSALGNNESMLRMPAGVSDPLVRQLRGAVQQGAPKVLLNIVASSLLLEGERAINILEADEFVKTVVDRELNVLPADAPLRMHFDRVLEFAKLKSCRDRSPPAI